jgi:hypothetical protein
MNCIFTSGEKGSECQRGCGRKLTANFREPPQADCKVKGIGDATAELLASYGIKKKSGCGCTGRQSNWNDFGDVHPTIANIGVKFLAAITRKKP